MPGPVLNCWIDSSHWLDPILAPSGAFVEGIARRIWEGIAQPTYFPTAQPRASPRGFAVIRG